ncbi:MAG TPA: protein kinase [Actinomycetota bacterium]|nr:protein kinase [Actinomycetota bacterium]
MDADAVPEVLADRYEIDSVLGEGGMAKVFRGTDNVLGRTVAVKVLGSQFARDETSVTRFRREAQSAASLNHPNVVSVYDTGSDDGVHWIVMEYLEGRTLKEVIQEEGPLEPQRAAMIARDVALALATAHEKGLVHRDVKPANIMITPSGETKVMDFGIARAVTSTGDPTLTRTGFVMGTAAYLSPEQAEGKPVDARSDIYSLGCVVYQMLTARPPFDGDSPVVVAGKHLSEEPEPISRINPLVPREVEAVVARAMRKNPEERYQEAREMAGDLSHAATGELPLGAAAGAATEPVPRPGGDTRVLPTVVPEPLRESFRRSPWLPAALVLALLAVLAMVAAFLLFRGGTPATRESPRQTPAESPTSEQPPSVSEAFNAFTAIVNQGVLDGVISEKGEEELFKGLDEINKNWFDGDVDEALSKIDELHGKIDELASKREISSPEVVSALHSGLDDLAEAMGSSSPPVGGEDGPGNSQGKGNAKGQDGDED